MDRHRLRGEGPLDPLPPSQPSSTPVGGFILCPVPVGCPIQAWWQQELYRRALAEAQAVVRPSILERELMRSWN
jgi:hypothetical protein